MSSRKKSTGSMEQLHCNIENVNINFRSTKSYVFVCSKCWTNWSKPFTLDINHNIDVKNDCTPASLKLLDDFLSMNPVLESIDHYCDNCEDETEWISIDAGIYPLVHLLNVNGFKTLYSCEGHHIRDDYSWSALPYIAFADTANNVILYDKLKKSEEIKETDWYIDDGVDLITGPIGFILRINKTSDYEAKYDQIDVLYQIIYNIIREEA